MFYTLEFTEKIGTASEADALSPELRGRIFIFWGFGNFPFYLVDLDEDPSLFSASGSTLTFS